MEDQRQIASELRLKLLAEIKRAIKTCGGKIEQSITFSEETQSVKSSARSEKSAYLKSHRHVAKSAEGEDDSEIVYAVAGFGILVGVIGLGLFFLYKGTESKKQ